MDGWWYLKIFMGALLRVFTRLVTGSGLRLLFVEVFQLITFRLLPASTDSFHLQP